MDRNVKDNLGRTLRLMLKPLVKLLIDQGMTHQEFSEAAKETYVEMALRKQVSSGKINRSRIAIVTGLTRKEVTAVISRAMEAELHPRTFSRSGRVLSGWHNDPDYTGPYGIPLEIPYNAPEGNASGPSFVNLVKVYSGDQSAKQMLDELLRIGAIVKTASKTFKPLRKDFEADRVSPKLIEQFGEMAYNVLNALTYNIQKNKVREGIFDRCVISNYCLDQDELKLFKQYLQDCGEVFLAGVDNWLAKNITKKDANTKRETFMSGLAMIHYTILQPEEKLTLQDLLAEIKLDENKRKRVLD